MSSMPKTSPTTEPKTVAILGSTGSIGCNTLDVIAQHPQRYQIELLTAQNNVDKLIEQAQAFQPKRVVIGNAAHYAKLKDALANTAIEVAAGEDALCDAASAKTDWVMAAIVGVAGLRPTMNAIRSGAQIAFASKECLICAGSLMMDACKRYGSTLLPVDSEHNAIFQVLDFEQAAQLDKLVLTASGGPFRTLPADALRDMTPEQATNHPNWSMGDKISVDSATMMNKALEMIEAYHLFPVEPSQIDAVIHPESIIHSFVHYRDGSVLAQLGQPDMRIPIAHTLAWPERIATNAPSLDLTAIGVLHFEAVDTERFPAMRLVREVLAGEQSLSIVFNAANEVAVAAFLANRIRFTDIVAITERALSQASNHPVTSLEDALYLDQQTRKTAQEAINGMA